MFQFASPTTCQAPAWMPVPGTTFIATASLPTYSTSPTSACFLVECPPGYTFAPVSDAELHAFSTPSAFPTLSPEDMAEVQAILDAPDTTGGAAAWGYLDELDHARWIDPSVALPTTDAAPANASPQLPTRRRMHRARGPEELECRRARRRSLQKGYEKTYRERQRETRDQLRREWLQLEHELKRELLAAANRAVLRVDRSITHEQPQREQRQAELQALCVERTVLRAVLRTEQRLEDASEYFLFSRSGHEFNALASTCSVLQYEFTW